MRYDNNFPSLKIEKNTFRGNRSFFAQLEQHEKLHESHEQVSDQLWRAFTSAEMTKKYWQAAAIWILTYADILA